jgi:hypothetical protein
MPLLVTLVLFAACAVNPWRDQQPPWTAETVVGADDARATLASGEVLLVAEPRIRGAELVGQQERGERSVLLSEVSRLETRRVQAVPLIANTAGTVLLTVGIALATVAVVIVSVF